MCICFHALKPMNANTCINLNIRIEYYNLCCCVRCEISKPNCKLYAINETQRNKLRKCRNFSNRHIFIVLQFDYSDRCSSALLFVSKSEHCNFDELW